MLLVLKLSRDKGEIRWILLLFLGNEQIYKEHLPPFDLDEDEYNLEGNGWMDPKLDIDHIINTWFLKPWMDDKHWTIPTMGLRTHHHFLSQGKKYDSSHDYQPLGNRKHLLSTRINPLRNLFLKNQSRKT